MAKRGPLEGKRMVEYDFLIAEALCHMLRSAGAVPMGPVRNTVSAIVTNELLDGVLLDV